MSVNSVSFAGWYCLPQRKLDKLNAKDGVKLGMDIARYKQKTQEGYSGLYLFVNPKREDSFVRTCKKYGITPVSHSAEV